MIFLNDLMHFIFPLLAAQILMSLVSLPFCNKFFKNLSDRGYSLAGLIGWIVTAYIYFFTATFFKLNTYTLLFSLIFWIAINLYLFLKDKELYINTNWRHVLKINLGFTGLFIFLYFIIARDPQIYQIERFMDFGFIKSLFNSQSLPPQDSWMIGKTINYYYFGHFLAYTILKFTRIPPEQGFFIINCWVFTNVCINIYRLSQDYFFNLVQKERYAKIAGILGIFLFQFAGTLYLLKWVKEYFFSIEKPAFWYADIARSIDHTITEVPLFSFLEATSHAHIFGFANGIIVLTILFSLWSQKLEFNLKNKYLYLLSFILGIAYLTNSWDLVTLGILSAFVILTKYKNIFSKTLFLLVLINLGILLVTVLPWQISFHNPLGGIGFVRNPSSVWELLMFWGGFLFLSLITLYHSKKEENIKFFIAVFFASLFFLILIETIYFKDVMSEGEWYRANTVFKITSEVWLWFSVILGTGISYTFYKSKKMSFFVIGVLLILTIYPVKTLQYFKDSKKYTGLSNPVYWFEQRYPGDYQAYSFLKNSEFKGNIVEAAGDSYTDSSFFSTLLGMPTIIGWSGHEWTWRGTNAGLDERRSDVLEIYTGIDVETSKQILNKYDISYIILGSAEKRIYGNNIKTSKILSLGEVLYQNQDTIVILTKSN